jgi:uncharacterized C2H2 Zn-finger protein
VLLIPAKIEVKCPKCGKLFQSEEEMLEHYDSEHGDMEEPRRGRHRSKKKMLALAFAAVFVLILVGSVVYVYAVPLMASRPSDNTIPDRDHDGMSDQFELAVGMNPDVYNARYAIVVNTKEGSWSGDDLASFLINQEKFEPEHVIKLIEGNATKANFMDAVSKVSREAGGNDTVIISFEVDSSDSGVGLRDSFMSYKEMDKTIDAINPGRMLITVSGCGNEAPIAPLSAGHTQRVVSDMPSHWHYAFSKSYLNIDHFPSTATFDLDGNGYISFSEQLETCAKYQTGAPSVNMSDKDGIASSLYLGDFSVSDVNARR